MENNTSVDDFLNPVEILDESSDLDILNEFLLGAQSKLNTHVKMSGYLNDTVTSTNQIEPSSTFSSIDSSDSSTFENFYSVVNEPTCTSIDMASDTNHEKGSPCNALADLPVNSLQRHVEGSEREMVPSFCNGQSTLASSNGLTYQMLKNVVRI